MVNYIGYKCYNSFSLYVLHKLISLDLLFIDLFLLACFYWVSFYYLIPMYGYPKFILDFNNSFMDILKCILDIHNPILGYPLISQILDIQ